MQREHYFFLIISNAHTHYLMLTAYYGTEMSRRNVVDLYYLLYDKQQRGMGS